MPQKITTRLAAVRGEKVKMWGKSPRSEVVILQGGKPYGLKGHVYRSMLITERFVSIKGCSSDSGGLADRSRQ